MSHVQQPPTLWRRAFPESTWPGPGVDFNHKSTVASNVSYGGVMPMGGRAEPLKHSTHHILDTPSEDRIDRAEIKLDDLPVEA